MPKPNSAHITMILDRSGSMSSVATDVIGAVNKFIDDQKAVPGECTWTLVQFDDQAPFDVIDNHVSMSNAKHLNSETYKPRGNTPLLDAIGKGIVTLGERLAAMQENDRPARVVFVVQTDGLENASKEYTKARIKEMIQHQTETYKWNFVFLGANQDAIASGGSMGFSAGSSASNSHSGHGYKAAMGATGQNVVALRCSVNPDASLSAFSEEQRSEAMKS